MKRLSVNERDALARLAAAAGEPRTPVQLRAKSGPAVFFVERYCERLADRGLAERLEHAYGRSVRAYVITARGERIAEHLRVERDRDIAELVDVVGREDLARARYGDWCVDEWFTRVWDVNVDAMRREAVPA